MSKQKLHPISAVIYFFKALKDMIVPIIFIIVANGLNFTFDVKDERFFSQMVPLLFMLLALIAFLAFGIIKWWTFKYWFEEQELRVQYGLFVKKKRFIPFDRIQTLNYKEGIFHRPFGLVLVAVETAGGSGKAEAEFTAITKAQAAQIEQEMNKAKGKEVSEIDEEIVEQNVIFTMSPLEQVTLSTTSGGIGLVIFGVLTVLSQVVELLPIEWLMDGLYELIKYSLLFAVVIAFAGLIVAWIISIVWTMISYFDYKVMVQDDRLIISRGLIEKKRITVPLNRVQAVRIVENPLRQAMGFATVQIESAGGSGGQGKNEGLTGSVKLFPLIRKKDMYEPLRELFPHLHVDEPEQVFISPKRARPFFYRIDFLWYAPVVGALSYFFYPYGLLSLLVVVPIIVMGIWQHKTMRAYTIDHQVVFQYRLFSKTTFFAEKQRIQSMSLNQSIFQKRRNIATVDFTVKSGVTGMTARAFHIEKEHAEQLLNWYEHH